MKPALFVTFACATATTVQAVAIPVWSPPPFCTAIEDIVTILGADPTALSFCSSFLHIPAFTSVATATITPTPATATDFVTTMTTITTTDTVSVTVSSFTTTSTTITSTSTCTPYTFGARGPARRSEPPTFVTTATTTATTTAPKPPSCEKPDTTVTATAQATITMTTTKTTTPTTVQSTSSTPTAITDFPSTIISSACSCLSIETSTTSVATTSTAPQPTSTTIVTSVVTSTETTSTTTTVTTTVVSVQTFTATANTISTLNGTYTTPEGNVYNHYSRNDFGGTDIDACPCSASNTDCITTQNGLNLGTCNSFDTCQNACDQFNAQWAIAFGRKCVAVSYTTSSRQICYLKYDYNGSPPCGQFYTDLYVDSAVLQSFVRP